MSLFDFGGVLRGLRSAVSQLAALRAEIEKLRRRRDEIESAPAARADVLALFDRYVQGRAAEYRANMARAVADVASPGTFKKLAEPHPIRDEVLLGLNARGGNGRNPVDALLAALAPAMVAELVRRAVETAPWPGPEGLPVAARAAAVAELDEQIAKLLKSERELIAASREAGVELPES